MNTEKKAYVKPEIKVVSALSEIYAEIMTKLEMKSSYTGRGNNLPEALTE